MKFFVILHASDNKETVKKLIRRLLLELIFKKEINKWKCV